jgi:signal transduction histidine kinase
MAAILGYGRLLHKSAPEDGQLGNWAEALLCETTETTDMITRFLDFARPLNAERHPINLAECLESAMRLVEPQARVSGVIINPLQLPANEVSVDGDEILLKQVFVNLIQNAVEASSRGAHITARVFPANTGRWLVAIVDEGCGIPVENQSRIFHPFFTTKDAGTGLGLALARKIAVTHGGSLVLQHSSKAGSTFLVTLPMSRETAQLGSTPDAEHVERA